MNASPARLAAALADRYRVDRELGAGGMATVYLAHDLRHERDVAIKVLHPDLGAVLGAERFLAEIKVTAKLQHPHILPLLDSGAADGLLYYVMPYVRGETLRARLERETQLAIPDAVRLAGEVADALEHAHRQGVIHRDIKPENILLQDGHALVADFGIALAVQQAGGQRMTQTGLSLGTPQYMAPEQATGEKTVDARADLYALAAVTYEMLTGAPPFTGATVQAIMARVMTSDAEPLTRVRKTVPPGVEAAVLQGLAKLPADRFASAREYAQALRGEGGRATTARPAANAAAARTGGVWRIAAMLCAVAAVTAGVGWWRATRNTGTRDAGMTRFTIERLEGSQVVALYSAMDVSTAGRLAAFIARDSVGVSRVHVRAFDDVQARRLEGTEGASQLFLSPDGAWLAFIAEGKLKKVPVTGGNPESLADVRIARGGHWGTDGNIYLGDAGRIVVVPASGGTPRTLKALVATGRLADSPRLHTDGRTLFFTDWAGTPSTSRLMAYALDRDTVLTLGLRGSLVLGVRQELLVYANEAGAIYGVPYVARSGTVAGEPRLLTDAVASDNSNLPVVTLDADGALIYRMGDGRSQLTLMQPGGTPDVLTDGLVGAAEPRLSPDGRRIGLTTSARTGSTVWTYDLAARTLSRLRSSPAGDTAFQRLEWTPDGGRLVMRTQPVAGRSYLATTSVNGAGAVDLLHRDASNDLWEGVVSPDARYLLYRSGSGAAADLRYREMQGDTASRPFVATPATEQEGRFSPDGRWVVYSSDEAGTGLEVYLRAFPDGPTAFKVSDGGGVQPVWARDGRSVYYIASEGVLLRARLASPPSAAAIPQVVGRDTLVRSGFDLPRFRGHAFYDVLPDGRLVLLRPMDGAQRLVVAQGWLAARRAEWEREARR